MKKQLFSILLIVLSLTGMAQKNGRSLQKSIVTLSLVSPGLTFETAINNNQSLYFSSLMGIGYRYESINGRSQSDFIVSPVVLANFRSYFNLDKRSRAGKSTHYNSGNYIGFMVAHQFEPIKKSDNIFFTNESVTTLGPIWGIQRNNTFSFGLNLGVGALISPSQTAFGVIGGLNFGLNLSKKSR